MSLSERDKIDNLSRMSERDKIDNLSRMSERDKITYTTYMYSLSLSLTVKGEVVVRSLRTTTPSPYLDRCKFQKYKILML